MTQKKALEILKLGYTTFLTGPAGSGKSFVLREYIDYIKRHGVRYAVTASTGIASTHVGGTTIHSWSGIGVKQSLSVYELDALEEKPQLYKRWNATEVLIIDEVSMLHASFIDTLDTVARHMRRNEAPFGGMQVVFCGDFFQLPPVIKEFSMKDSSSVYAFQSQAWKEAKPVICYLTEQYRQNDDKLLSLLDAVRKGEVDDSHYEILKERNTDGSSSHIKLFTHNENVDDINKKEFAKIKGEVYRYDMVTKGKAQFVQSLKNNCLADEVLELKVGAKVICIKNSQDRAYVNGSMGEVVAFDKERAPVVELSSGKKVTIKADSWKIEEDGKVKAEISQLPIKLAWAITVHKSQGMTLDNAEVDLSRAFASGQGYVALSRLTKLEGLMLKGFTQQALYIDDVVRNADSVFRKKSEQAEQALLKYDTNTITELQEQWLITRGGSKEEIEEIESDMEEKTPTHLLTYALLVEGMSLGEVARKRELTEDTIVGHIEKLVEHGEKVPFDLLLPDKKTVQKITKAIKELETDKLSPLFDFCDGKISYQTIRIVRAYERMGKNKK